MKAKISAVLVFLAITSTLLAAGFGGTGLLLVDRRSADQPLRTGESRPGSPAALAGIKSGYFLISIDGSNAVNLSLTQAVDTIRGLAGVSVTLELADPLAHQTNKFTITRVNMYPNDHIETRH